MNHDWRPDGDMLRCPRCGIRANEAGTKYVPQCRLTSAERERKLDEMVRRDLGRGAA